VGRDSTKEDLAVARRAAREHGVLGIDELRDCGLSTQRISIRARNGRLHRLYPGVYAVGHDGLSARGRYLAAVKASGADAVLSHRSAADLWGFLNEDSSRFPHVTIPTTCRRRVTGIRMHRTTPLRHDEWLTYERIRVTTPVRTVIDLAAELTPPLLRDVIRKAIGTRRLRMPQLLRALPTVGPRPGIRKLRRVIADGVPTRSELEDVLLDLISEGGFVPPNVNVALNLDGRRVIPDFRWPSARLIVEADGAAWHDNAVARAGDIERQRLLEAHGERIVRVNWRQAIGEPRRTRRRLLEAGAPLRRDRGA
jgi:hypothetical protein